jgi:hypothetical protein
MNEKEVAVARTQDEAKIKGKKEEPIQRFLNDLMVENFQISSLALEET